MFSTYRMFLKYSFRVLLILVVASVLFPFGTLFAVKSPLSSHRYAQNEQMVTLNISSGFNITTFDPTLASDLWSMDAIQNLFLGLTDLDPFTNEIVPEMATSWDVSNDGLIWTFHLREDVMWMQYDPDTETATEIRSVVAEDFAYAIKRACDPRLIVENEAGRIVQGYYGQVLADVIAGCEVVYQTEHENVTDDLIFGETTQIAAINDTTLEITLQRPAAYFLTMTSLVAMNAVPPEIVEQYGDDWTVAGNIVTNGPYMLVENEDEVGRLFLRNPEYPSDLWKGGNIDLVSVEYIRDGGTVFALYQDNQMDMSPYPYGAMYSIEDPAYGPQLRQRQDNAVFYFGFNYHKPPFDNVHVRRAFSAIIDRQTFVNQIQGGRGLPVIHFMPPGIPLAPAIDDIGVGFDPEYAREQLALAGYPDCESFPQIDIFTYQGTGVWGEFLVERAEEFLGCDPALFTVQQLEFMEILARISTDTPTPERPNVWTLGWASDYPDPHDWLYTVLFCENENPFIRPCTELDSAMESAAVEQNTERRRERYADIENGFFGENGEYPIAPIYVRARDFFVKSWYGGPHETDGIYGGQHWDAYTIDMEAKLAAQAP